MVVLPRVITQPPPGSEPAKLCQGGDGQEEEAASFQQKTGLKTRSGCWMLPPLTERDPIVLFLLVRGSGRHPALFTTGAVGQERASS